MTNGKLNAYGLSLKVARLESEVRRLSALLADALPKPMGFEPGTLAAIFAVENRSCFECGAVFMSASVACPIPGCGGCGDPIEG